MVKRAIQFGIIYWVIIFVVVSILLFIPGAAGNDLWQNIILWIALIPITLGLARWYFRNIDPTPINGVKLWVVLMIVGFILDTVITVPLFISQQFDGNTSAAFQSFYSDWKLYVGFAWSLLLLLYAGYEFDRAPHLGVQEEPEKE